MNRSRMQITVDEAHHLVTLRYVGEGEGKPYNFIDQLREEGEFYRYDMILDFLGYDWRLSENDKFELAKQWHDFAKGRDVGRRTAIVAKTLLTANQDDVQAIFPHRHVTLFAGYEDGLRWVMAVSNPDEDSGVQLI